MSELVSIMIPAYNAEKYIGRCLQSLIEQTYQDIEIVVVNDGSKDSTKQICEEYAAKDARVRLITQENGGEGAARNTGLKESRGKYLCFVDADDYVKPEFVENMINMQKDNDAGMVICGFTELKGEAVLNETSGPVKHMNQEQAMEQLLREDSFKGYVWNKMFDLDIIRNYQLSFDTSLAVWTDVLFVFQYMLHIQKVVFDPTPMYYYIYVESSASHAANHLLGVEKSYCAIRAKEQMIKDIPANYQLVKKQIAVRFVQSSLATIRNIGYWGKDNSNEEYYQKCKKYIKDNKKLAKDRLSTKERILAFLSCNMPSLLFKLYKKKAS